MERPPNKVTLHGNPQRLLADGEQLVVAPGHCLPLGASCPPGCAGHVGGLRINFALPSTKARKVGLMFSARESGDHLAEVELDPATNRTGHVWHIEVTGLAAPVRYSWIVDGLEVADPWARALLRTDAHGRAVHHAFFPLPEHSWRHQRPPRRPLQDLLIYELHVKGFTAHPSSGVARPGSYEGLREKIPYLKDLGVMAVELMPVHHFDPSAIVFINPFTGQGLSNYWGYDPVGLMAPAAHYASTGHPLQAVSEFRALVDDLHGAGIEVLLDVVLNHTAEGNQRGPTLHFRALDDELWYMRGEGGSYLDYTGCGNTFNCNHPVVRDYILSCLRGWVTDFGVDGFRFDLAAVMGRDPEGRVLVSAPVLEQITLDPVLAGTRLIAEAWDAAGLYQVGSFDEGLRGARRTRPGGGWAQWNGRFRDDLRRLVRGDAGLTGAAASRLCGSSDLFQWNGRGPAHSLNFVTCHDGFTLADLVSHDRKHNEANGEHNRDGLNENFSWNCGVEGPTERREVLELRARQSRNHLALLLLSQGVPMLLAGDECGRSQRGNNNAWCQDNELTWLDWSQAERHADLRRFVQGLARLRAAHACLRRDRFLTGEDLAWHGTEPGKPDFGPGSRCLAWRLRGQRDAEGRPGPDLYGAFNFWREPVDFRLPGAGAGHHWRLVLDTADGLPPRLEPEPPALPALRRLEAFSVVLLSRHPD